MRAVVQRVAEAAVEVDGQVVGTCGQGFVALVAAHKDDGFAEAERLADRVWGMRVFSDAEGKMNLALKDLPSDRRVGVLAVSNFTLYGDASKNRRPSFVQSAPFEQGKALFDRFVDELKRLGCEVETGVFGAHMTVRSVNDGPVTLIVDVPPAGEAVCSTQQTDRIRQTGETNEGVRR